MVVFSESLCGCSGVRRCLRCSSRNNKPASLYSRSSSSSKQQQQQQLPPPGQQQIPLSEQQQLSLSGQQQVLLSKQQRVARRGQQQVHGWAAEECRRRGVEWLLSQDARAAGGARRASLGGKGDEQSRLDDSALSGCVAAAVDTNAAAEAAARRLPGEGAAGEESRRLAVIADTGGAGAAANDTGATPNENRAIADGVGGATDAAGAAANATAAAAATAPAAAGPAATAFFSSSLEPRSFAVSPKAREASQSANPECAAALSSHACGACGLPAAGASEAAAAAADEPSLGGGHEVLQWRHRADRCLSEEDVLQLYLCQCNSSSSRSSNCCSDSSSGNDTNSSSGRDCCSSSSTVGDALQLKGAHRCRGIPRWGVWGQPIGRRGSRPHPSSSGDCSSGVSCCSCTIRRSLEGSRTSSKSENGINSTGRSSSSISSMNLRGCSTSNSRVSGEAADEDVAYTIYFLWCSTCKRLHQQLNEPRRELGAVKNAAAPEVQSEVDPSAGKAAVVAEAAAVTEAAPVREAAAVRETTAVAEAAAAAQAAAVAEAAATAAGHTAVGGAPRTEAAAAGRGIEATVRERAAEIAGNEAATAIRKREPSSVVQYVAAARDKTEAAETCVAAAAATHTLKETVGNRTQQQVVAPEQQPLTTETQAAAHRVRLPAAAAAAAGGAAEAAAAADETAGEKEFSDDMDRTYDVAQQTQTTSTENGRTEVDRRNLQQQQARELRGPLVGARTAAGVREEGEMFFDRQRKSTRNRTERVMKFICPWRDMCVEESDSSLSDAEEEKIVSTGEFPGVHTRTASAADRLRPVRATVNEGTAMALKRCSTAATTRGVCTSAATTCQVCTAVGTTPGVRTLEATTSRVRCSPVTTASETCRSVLSTAVDKSEEAAPGVRTPLPTTAGTVEREAANISTAAAQRARTPQAWNAACANSTAAAASCCAVYPSSFPPPKGQATCPSKTQAPPLCPCRVAEAACVSAGDLAASLAATSDSLAAASATAVASVSPGSYLSKGEILRAVSRALGWRSTGRRAVLRRQKQRQQQTSKRFAAGGAEIRSGECNASATKTARDARGAESACASAVGELSLRVVGKKTATGLVDQGLQCVSSTEADAAGRGAAKLTRDAKSDTASRRAAVKEALLTTAAEGLDAAAEQKKNPAAAREEAESGVAVLEQLYEMLQLQEDDDVTEVPGQEVGQSCCHCVCRRITTSACSTPISGASTLGVKDVVSARRMNTAVPFTAAPAGTGSAAPGIATAAPSATVAGTAAAPSTAAATRIAAATDIAAAADTAAIADTTAAASPVGERVVKWKTAEADARVSVTVEQAASDCLTPADRAAGILLAGRRARHTGEHANGMIAAKEDNEGILGDADSIGKAAQQARAYQNNNVVEKCPLRRLLAAPFGVYVVEDAISRIEESCILAWADQARSEGSSAVSTAVEMPAAPATTSVAADAATAGRDGKRQDVRQERAAGEERDKAFQEMRHAQVSEETAAKAEFTAQWIASQSGRMKMDFGPRVNFKKRRVKVETFRGFPAFVRVLLQRFFPSSLSARGGRPGCLSCPSTTPACSAAATAVACAAASSRAATQTPERFSTQTVAAMINTRQGVLLDAAATAEAHVAGAGAAAEEGQNVVCLPAAATAPASAATRLLHSLPAGTAADRFCSRESTSVMCITESDAAVSIKETEKAYHTDMPLNTPGDTPSGKPAAVAFFAEQHDDGESSYNSYFGFKTSCGCGQQAAEGVLSSLQRAVGSATLRLEQFYPVELCLLDYSPSRGSHIDEHIDDAWLWGSRLLTFSLAGSTLLSFVSPTICMPLSVLKPLLRRIAAARCRTNSSSNHSQSSTHHRSRGTGSRNYKDSERGHKENVKQKRESTDAKNTTSSLVMGHSFLDRSDSFNTLQTEGKRTCLCKDAFDRDVRHGASQGVHVKLQQQQQGELYSTIHVPDDEVRDVYSDSSHGHSRQTHIAAGCIPPTKGHEGGEYGREAVARNKVATEEERASRVAAGEAGMTAAIPTEGTLKEGATNTAGIKKRRNLCTNERKTPNGGEGREVEDRNEPFVRFRVEIRIPLPARSMAIVTGAARHTWAHAIRAHHVWERRVALTLRELSAEFLQGGSQEAVGRQLLQVAAASLATEIQGE